MGDPPEVSAPLMAAVHAIDFAVRADLCLAPSETNANGAVCHFEMTQGRRALWGASGEAAKCCCRHSIMSRRRHGHTMLCIMAR